MKKININKAFSCIVMASMLATAVGAITPQTASADVNQQPIQVFYLPMPEDQVMASFKKITTQTTAGPMHSVTGISVTSNGAQIYYDQWENGYELDLANPGNIWNAGNLGGTQIWGNGSAADGCPPNIDGRTALACTNANDTLRAGNVIVLENDVTIPRVSSQIFYDSRDKVGSTKVVAVTRSVWAATPGTVLADAIEVYDTTRWGTSYEIPIGQNVSANNIFSYTSLLIVAGQNGTTVNISGIATPISLNQGDAYQVNGGINSGTTVTSNKPVMATLLTGKVGSTYASRWFELPPSVPAGQWTNSLWTAVGTTSSSYPAAVFVYNPDDAAAITVNYETKVGTGAIALNPNEAKRFQMPLKSGAHFFTSDGKPFLAVGVMDSSTSSADQTYDWGYTLVPDAWLTTAFVTGWAPGTANLSGNGSPVWVTAVKPTIVYVDYGSPAGPAPLTAPNGATYDASFPISAYESLQITGVGNTQTGMKVFTADNTSITGAWGEDPTKAQAGTPYLDVGYTIPPLPEVLLTKAAVVDATGDVNHNGKIDPGDTMIYTLTIRNNGAVTAFNTSVTDSIPTHTSYVPGSTTLNSVAVPDDLSVASRYPLENGVTVPTILIGASAVFSYKIQADAVPPSAPYASVINTAHALVNGTELTITITTPINSNASQCAINFTGSLGGSTVTTFQQNGVVFVKLTDADAAGRGTIQVTVVDPNTADRETVTLTEAGAGVFTGSVPSSTTSGLLPDDGALFTRGGDSITLAYTDPVYADTCSASPATIAVPAVTKSLYFEGNSDLTRVDPVGAADPNTIQSGINLGGVTPPTDYPFTVAASKDNYIRNSSTGTNVVMNFGKSTVISVRNRSGRPYRPLIAFNLASVIPAGATQIKTAVLSLYQTTGGTAYNVEVRKLTQDWVEGTGTTSGTTPMASNWTYRDATNTWTTPGGTYTGTVVATTSVGATANTTYNWNVQTLVQAWYDTPSTNYGLLLKAAAETASSGVTHTFASRDNTSGYPVPTISGTYTMPGVTTSSMTFTQPVSMASSLNLPNGGMVGVTAYINVTAGAPLGSLNATAEIGVVGIGTPLITLSSPTVTLDSGTIYRLVWSGALSGDKTVSASQQIYTTITTNSPGVAFYILYGSQTRPSKIDLPTTTVIKVNSLGFYDAPYPGGVEILNPANGQTVYIRAAVSDPFGSYDISSANLAITDPSSAVTNVALTDAQMVDSSGSVKTYEYAWAAPASQGTYGFTFTAKEGLENTVSDHISSSVNIVNQDTGTPSKTEFTAGSNGTATSSYDSTASPTNQLCMRVTDYDQNTLSGGIETVTVNVTSATGDTQVVTLTETGANSGVFAACISRDTSSAANASTLYTRPGDLLSVSYTDPNDPADQTSATAMMTTASTVLVLGKQRVTPANGFAAVGTSVRFDLTVSNPSAVELNTVAVTDTYPSCLTYTSASIAPDTVDTTAHTLDWNDVGPLAAHTSQAIRVYFTVSAVCSPAATSNLLDATAIDPGDNTITATQVSASLTTTRPALAVTKTLTSGSPATVGSDVTFQINLNNTGTTTITSLPLTDSYSAYCMEFKLASDGGTGSGGTAQWANLGPLNASAQKNVTVTFTVSGPCTPAQNLAVVDSAIDTNGDPVPTAQGSAAVTTTVQAPAFGVTKTLTDPASGPAYVGDILTYTLEINNSGPNALVQVVATDNFPACLSFVSSDLMAPTSSSSSQAVWNTLVPPLPPLLAGQTMTLTVQMRAVDTSPGCQNSVTVSAVDQYDQAAGPHTSSALAVEIQNALRGVVYEDLNANGVQDSGESGLADAGIGLYRPGSDGLLGTADDVLIDTATTLASGAFLFADLPEGDYLVRETNPVGYVSTTSDNRIVFVPANNTVTVDFGDRVGGAISGEVFNDLNANGLHDSAETPLSGVTVTLKDNTGATVGATTTGLTGSYEFTGLLAGSYTVIETDLPAYTSTTANSVAVTLTTGGVASVNYGDQQSGTVSGVVYDDVNGNGIQDASESGISGVSIALKDATGTTVATATTASDGGYQFTSVSAGSYSVTEADPSGYVSTTANLVLISVSAGGSASANFGDRQPGQVSGVVFDDLNGSGLQNPGEPGLSGVQVTLYDSGGSIVSAMLTDSSGNYLFTGVAAGAYDVVESDPSGFTSVTANTVAVSVPAGGSASANFGDQAIGMVSGTVYNDLNGNTLRNPGEPGLGGVTVTLRDSVGALVGTTTTAGDGSFQFTGVIPGAYTVIESDPTGFSSVTPNTVGVSVPSGGSASANFGDRQTGSVSGAVFNDLNGSGLQDAGEPGIGGVQVDLLLPGGGSVASTTTAGDGSFQFSSVTPGSYTVNETDPSGYVSTTGNVVPVSVPANGSASASFGDRQVGTVSGVVFNDLNGSGLQDAGEPGLGGVNVELQSDLCTAGVDCPITTTAGDGSYLFSEVVSGPYDVVETDPAGFTSVTANRVTVSVPAGGSASANFGDQATGLVTGAVYNDLNGNSIRNPGEPGLGGVTVELRDSGGTVVDSTLTAGDGSFQFSGVSAGAYAVVEFDPSGYVSVTPNAVAISVPAGGSASANFGDRQTGTVSGVFFNDLNGSGAQGAGEAGLGGISVELRDGSCTPAVNCPTQTTASDGSYLFTGVVGGSYTVAASAPSGFIATTPGSVSITLPAGGSASANFGAQQVGSVAGVVFNDLNGSGIQDAGEPGLGGVAVELRSSGCNAGEDCPTTATAGDGSYLFTSVSAGSYTVFENDPAGFTSVTPNSVDVTVPAGGSANANFADQLVGMISGTVYNDLNGNSAQNPGELGLSGVTVELRDGSSTLLDTTTTDGSGLYQFSNLGAGNYSVVEIDPAGFFSVTPNSVAVILGAGESASAYFGDRQTGSVIVAVDDSGSAVNGAAGGQSLANVLVNDTLNGAAALLADVNLTQESSTDPGVTLDTGTGAVNVAPGTAAGDYTLTYKICDKAAPTICDTAVVTVPVQAPTAVNLTYFTALPVRSNTIAVKWHTVMESDTLGFNIYRSQQPGGPFIKLNPDLIQANNPGGPSGSAYIFADSSASPNVTYYYQLEHVSMSLVSSIYGQVFTTDHPVFIPILKH